MSDENVSILEMPGSGARFAVMPEADFLIIEKTLKRLGIALRNKDAAENVRDIIEASIVRGRIERGEEEAYPSDVVAKLVSGENAVRVFRNWRGISSGELADKAGISASYLSGIENGGKSGSIDVMKRIARALEIDLQELAD